MINIMEHPEVSSSGLAAPSRNLLSRDSDRTNLQVNPTYKMQGKEQL